MSAGPLLRSSSNFPRRIADAYLVTPARLLLEKGFQSLRRAAHGRIKSKGIDISRAITTGAFDEHRCRLLVFADRIQRIRARALSEQRAKGFARLADQGGDGGIGRFALHHLAQAGQELVLEADLRLSLRCRISGRTIVVVSGCFAPVDPAPASSADSFSGFFFRDSSAFARRDLFQHLVEISGDFLVLAVFFFSVAACFLIVSRAFSRFSRSVSGAFVKFPESPAQAGILELVFDVLGFPGDLGEMFLAHKLGNPLGFSANRFSTGTP